MLLLFFSIAGMRRVAPRITREDHDPSNFAWFLGMEHNSSNGDEKVVGGFW
jgi:hypothetical protein